LSKIRVLSWLKILLFSPFLINHNDLFSLRSISESDDHFWFDSFKDEISDSKHTEMNVNLTKRFNWLLESLACLQMLRGSVILNLSHFWIFFIMLNKEICENLSHKLSFFIKNIEKLGFIRSFQEWLNWDSEFSN
jgi:hypothetical protein